MINRLLLLAGLSICFVTLLNAQKITYSEPDKDDSRQLNFDIVGKINDHFLIYKNTRNRFSISMLDVNDMKLIGKQDLAFLPDRVLGVEFLTHRDFFYVFYQYQHRNNVYSAYAKLDGNVKLLADPVVLDTTQINYSSNNKIYTFINSDDKKKVLVFKINSKDERNYVVTTFLYDENMGLVKKSTLNVRMPDKSDFLNEFSVDNDGDVVFLRPSGSSQKDNITRLSLLYKPAMEDTTVNYDITLSKIYLDDIRLKVDNANKSYLITSFFSKSRRGNIDGLYASIWNKISRTEKATNNIVFSDELRGEARNDGSAKAAFNDYFLQNIVMRKDGGFVIASESAYTSSRGGMYNRWDYLYGSPFWSPMSSYYYYSPFYNYYYPWGRYNSFNNPINRYFADNIAILSFDSTANMEWGNVIKKSQFDDNTDNFIGYTTYNSGSEVHFIFNQAEKRTTLLNDQSIDAHGQITRNPTFRNLDKGYDFMPRYAKQLGARTLLAPCQYRNYICFAKIEF